MMSPIKGTEFRLARRARNFNIVKLPRTAEGGDAVIIVAVFNRFIHRFMTSVLRR